MRDERCRFRIVFSYKKITVARYAKHSMRKERLQVQDSILLVKKPTLTKAGKTLHQGQKVIG